MTVLVSTLSDKFEDGFFSQNKIKYKIQRNAPCILCFSSYLTTCGKHLPDRIISIRGEVWAHEISLSPPFIFNQATKVSGHVFVCYVMYLCVSGIDFYLFSTILIFGFGIVPTVWCFFFFSFH